MIRITRTKFLSAAGLLALLCVLVCPAGRADDLTITLDSPIVGTAGGPAITVFGDITNNTVNPIYFGNESLTFNDPTSLSGNPDVIINALFFGGPASVDAGLTLPGVDIFTLTIDPSAAPGTYGFNFYDLIGGTDPNCINDGCTGSSGTLEFSVTVLSPVTAPEPGSLALLASGLLVGLFVLRRAGH
jgi:PEP-CTERM motif